MNSFVKILGAFLLLVFSASFNTVDAQRHHKYKKHHYKSAQHHHKRVVHHHRSPARYVSHYRKPVKNRYYRPVVHHRYVRPHYRPVPPRQTVIVINH